MCLLMTRGEPEKRGDVLKSKYCNESLFALVHLVYRRGDRIALREFHNNRPVFRSCQGKPVRFVEFLEELRQQMLPGRWVDRKRQELADAAYDLTLAKFSNLPSRPVQPSSANGNRSPRVRDQGPDCRFYFQAFLNRLVKAIESKAPASQIELELLAARILQSFVQRHFYLSWLEAKRRIDPHVTRYIWNVNGGSITVYLPTDMDQGRRAWLEENVENPDPTRPGERERVQAIVNSRLLRGKVIEYREGSTCWELIQPTGAGESACIGSEITAKGLAKVIADEKANNIDKLRPKIRALGEKKLKELIFHIFTDLSRGDYKESEVAGLFGLNKSTFSRFAGSKWILNSSGQIPDLWLNTAHTIANYPPFMAAAREAGNGVEDRIRAIVNATAMVQHLEE